MNYQPFFNMHFLVSEPLLATLPALFQILFVCLGAFTFWYGLVMWIERR